MEFKLLKNAEIFVDKTFVRGKEILIYKDRIENIEKDSELHFCESFSEIIDLNNLTVIPGFIDTHTHMVGYGLSLLERKVDSVKSKEELLEFIREDVREKNEEIYVYSDFDESKWKEGELPQKNELDHITSQPVFLRRICGHFGIGNSSFIKMCLKLKEIDTQKIDFEKGFFYEDVPLNLYKYFPPSLEKVKKAILLAQEEFLSKGITSIHEFGTPLYFRAYEELEREGKLLIRVYFSLYYEYLDNLIASGIQSGFGNNTLKIGGIKLFMDGSVGAETAYFSIKYGKNNTHGLLLVKKEELTEILKKAEGAGLRLIVHAIGDKAIEEILKIYEKAEHPELHRIEHFEFPQKKSIEKAQKLGVRISIQPNFTGNWAGEGKMYAEKLKDKWKLSNPIKTMYERGIYFAFGSDAMPPDPLYGIKSAMNHPVEAERIDFETALELYTEKGASLSFEEDFKGKIKEGYLADLVILDREKFEVKMVIRGGKCVYDGRNNRCGE